jgi:hypothetical protein
MASLSIATRSLDREYPVVVDSSLNVFVSVPGFGSPTLRARSIAARVVRRRPNRRVSSAAIQDEV